MLSNVKAEAARMNMSIKELAERSDIRYQTLSDKINGRTKFSVDEAIKIKKVLGVDMPLEILFEET